MLLDDKAARLAARSRSLPVTGLLGVLKEAGRLGLLDLGDSIERLQRTAFRAAPALLKQVLEDF